MLLDEEQRGTMWGFNAVIILEDGGGRRSGLDRRSFSGLGCILEKRSGQDRRIHLDRRIRKEDFTNLMVSFEPKRKSDIYIEILGVRRMLFFGPFFGSLSWAMIISTARIFLG